MASDNKSFDDYTHKQISLFDNAALQIENAIGYHTLKHICNSGAITRFKQAHYNMVRLGIGMYGIGFNHLEKQHLKNISTLKTRISQLKYLQAGDTVGYSRNAMMTKDTTIATIPIGYADGFSRKLGNGHFSVSINNQIAYTVGNICMDMCMIDITGINADEGDEVIVFNDVIRVEDIAKQLNTIPYEVLTGISQRVKRIYYYE